MFYEAKTKRIHLIHKFANVLLLSTMLILLILTAMSNGAVKAQAVGVDVTHDILAFIGSDGAMWMWSSGSSYPTQVTTFPEYVSVTGIDVAPDGRYAALAARVSIVDDQNNFVDKYTDVWLYDIASGELRQLTPERPPVDENGQVGGGEFSTPVFSPYGDMLAWVYYDEQDGSSHFGLDFYTLATGEIRRIVGGIDLGYQDGGLSLPIPSWDPVGIWSLTTTNRVSDNQFHPILAVYDPIANVARNFDVWREDMGSERTLRYLRWAEADGQPVIAFTREDVWYALDPETGEVTGYSGAPTTYLAGYTVTDSGSGANFTLTMPDGKPVILPERTGPLLVSTGGGGVLFAGDGFIGIWENGVATPFDPPLQIGAWPGSWAGAKRIARFENVEPTGTTQLELFGSPSTPPTAQANDCALPPRLEVGQTAQVIPGQGANALRAEAGLDAARIGSIPEGGQMTLLGAAVCRDVYHWWQVDYDGQVGWTAEGDPETGTYWIERVP